MQCGLGATSPANNPQIITNNANGMRESNAIKKTMLGDVPGRPWAIPGRPRSGRGSSERPARQNVTKREECIARHTRRTAIAAGGQLQSAGRRTARASDAIFISRGLRNALRFLNLSLRSCVFSHKILKKSPLLKKCCNIGPKLAKRKPCDSRKVTTMAFLRGIL